MGDFKSNKNSWPRYGICVFYVPFRNMYPGVDFKIRVGFCVFCEEFGNLIFESQYFDVKRSLQKSQKVTKSAKPIPSPTTGYYGQFHKWLKSWPRYGNLIFYGTFRNMSPWISFQIKGFFLFSKLTLFWRVYKFTFWGITFRSFSII